MASFAVTHDIPVQIVTAARPMTITINVNGTGLSVYAQVNNIGHFPMKAREGFPLTISLATGDVVQAFATGTGVIDVTMV